MLDFRVCSHCCHFPYLSISMFPINPAFRRLVGDYEDKSQLGFECGEEAKGGTVYEPKDTQDDLKNCGWRKAKDYAMMVGDPEWHEGPVKKVQMAFPWMEHMCFNLFSQIH